MHLAKLAWVANEQSVHICAQMMYGLLLAGLFINGISKSYLFSCWPYDATSIWSVQQPAVCLQVPQTETEFIRNFFVKAVFRVW